MAFSWVWIVLHYYYWSVLLVGGSCLLLLSSRGLDCLWPSRTTETSSNRRCSGWRTRTGRRSARTCRWTARFRVRGRTCRTAAPSMCVARSVWWREQTNKKRWTNINVLTRGFEHFINFSACDTNTLFRMKYCYRLFLYSYIVVN